jgi:hypothetical protein
MRLAAALAAGLGCALLVIAFLLGRLSARPTEAGLPEAGTPPKVAVAGAQSPAPGLAEPAPSASPLGSGELSPPSSFGAGPPPRSERAGDATLATELRPQAAPAAETPAITAYFAQVESLDHAGAGDPQDFARSLLASVTSGDFSGFDDLVRQARRQQEGLRNITPPPPCMEYHRLALSLSGESVSMLESLRAALAKGDTTSLMAMAPRAQNLELQANELKAMAEAIRRPARP